MKQKIINFIKEKKTGLLSVMTATIYYINVSKFHHNIFINEESATIIFFKILSFFITVAGFSFIFKVLKELYLNNPKYIRFTKVFWAYFTVNIIIYTLTNGGVYNGDEAGIIYNAASGYLENPVAHFLTISYYIISYCIFPFVKSAVLMNIIIISGVIGYIYSDLASLYNIKYKFLWLITFFLPPILRMNIQPLRSNIYYPFLLLLFAYIFFRAQRKENIKTSEVVIYGLFSTIVCIWRSENIVLLFMLPLMIRLFFDKFITIKNLLTYSLILIGLTSVTNRITSEYDYTYKLVALTRPLVSILKTDFTTDNKENDLKIINSVFESEKYLNDSEENAIFLEAYSKEISQKNVNKLFMVYAKLVLMNFTTYLKDRVNIIKENTLFLRDSVYIYKNPKNIKEKTLNILELRNSNYDLTFFTNIVYNVFIPFILIIFSFIYGIIKKNKYIAVITGTSAILTAVTCAACAEQFFHYYIQCYILGYFFLFFYISVALNKKTT